MDSPKRTLVLFVCAVILICRGEFCSYAACSHSISNTEIVDANGSIHSTDSDYYRGAVIEIDKGIGVCTVTAYMSAVNYASGTYYNYTAKLWSLDGDNLDTLLGTGEDVYQGGNWTEDAKTFHFYTPVALPSRFAITISDDAASAHPTYYHVWHRTAPQSGQQACYWNAGKAGVCTSGSGMALAITYVETPFLTADWSHTGWPRLEIPEWAPYGANYCDMRDDNITVACELPEDLPSGNHKLKGRFCQSDDNASRCSGWAYLRYRVVKSGETVTSVQNHPSGDATATITGEYR